MTPEQKVEYIRKAFAAAAKAIEGELEDMEIPMNIVLIGFEANPGVNPERGCYSHLHAGEQIGKLTLLTWLERHCDALCEQINGVDTSEFDMCAAEAVIAALMGEE